MPTYNEVVVSTDTTYTIAAPGLNILVTSELLVTNKDYDVNGAIVMKQTSSGTAPTYNTVNYST